jgi:hypothetical protein
MQPTPGMHNEDVAAAFDEMAELLAIGGENPFRIRAYQRAAQVIRSLPRPLAELHGTEEFDALPGIGADLAGKIDELLRTGQLRALEQLRRKVPAGLRELLRLPGLGPTRVRALHASLGIRSVSTCRGDGARIARVRVSAEAARRPGGRSPRTSQGDTLAWSVAQCGERCARICQSIGALARWRSPAVTARTRHGRRPDFVVRASARPTSPRYCAVRRSEGTGGGRSHTLHGRAATAWADSPSTGRAWARRCAVTGAAAGVALVAAQARAGSTSTVCSGEDRVIGATEDVYATVRPA